MGRKELPTEAQWELAARGGLEGATFAWGNEFMPKGKVMANIWKGRFPSENLKSQPPGTEAVGSYPPNGYELYDMIGNVWEWTKDWYREQHPENPAKACCTPKILKGEQKKIAMTKKYYPQCGNHVKSSKEGLSSVRLTTAPATVPPPDIQKILIPPQITSVFAPLFALSFFDGYVSFSRIQKSCHLLIDIKNTPLPFN